MEKQARRIQAREGAVLRRPVLPGHREHFPLAHVRTGPPSPVPVLVLPGGPGLASVVPYQSFRRLAAREDLDVLMVEHRGVGLSRHTETGAPLPREAVTIEQAADDLAAVLDEHRVDTAVIAGSSYGSYLAQALAVRHPARVAALILDSPKLSVAGDLSAQRAHRRRLFWEGATAETARAAELVRRLAAAGEPMRTLSHNVQVTYEFAGATAVERALQARIEGRGKRLWDSIARLGGGELEGQGIPYFMEPDAVAGISFGQLGYGLPPDGGPLDPQLTFTEVATRQPGYGGEPFDFPAEVPDYRWPTVVVSGNRDLRTPRPIAEQIVALAPAGVLVRLRDTGHSALDTHQLALLQIIRATAAGNQSRLPAVADRIAALPRKGASGRLGPILGLEIRATTRPLR